MTPVSSRCYVFCVTESEHEVVEDAGRVLECPVFWVMVDFAPAVARETWDDDVEGDGVGGGRIC